MKLFSVIRNAFELPDFFHIEDKIVAHILFGFLTMVPPFFLVIIYLRIQARDSVSIIILLAYFLVLLSNIWFLRMRKVKLSVISIIISTLITLTALCTWGQGIRDISMVAFSGVIILTCLLLNRKEFFLFLFLTVLCIAWLAFGEIYHLYVPRSIQSPDVSDFIVISIIILMINL